MRRSAATLAALSLLAFASACRDGKQSLFPTDPASPNGAARAIVPGTCTTLSQLTTLASTVFASGGPNKNSVLGKLDNLDKLIKKGKITEAQAQARDIVAFIQQKAAGGTLAGTQAQVQALINGILCFAGLAADSFLIYPSDQAQIIISPTGLAGVSLQANTVGTPSLLTITILDPNAPSPLITKLDKYPTNIDLTISSPLTKPAIVAVCPAASVPTAVLPSLRVGHQASTGFELTPRADGSFLNCQSIAPSRIPEWMQRIASFVMPRTLYAKQFEAERGGGVGGTSTEFSPFGAVDEELRGGGVGGTSTEFMRTPEGSPTARTVPPAKSSASRSLAPTARTNALAVTCASSSAPVNQPLAPECRPAIQITTRNGTIMQNVPVNWAVNLGGGTIAPHTLATSACGAFGATAATATDVNGTAGVCWTLGGSAGINTVIATPTAGGDAPAGVTFAPSGLSFTATATAVSTPITATAGSGTMTLGGAVPSLPCAISGLLPADVGTVTCTTALPATLVPGTNVTSPVVSPASPPNYVVSLANGALDVRYVQLECLPAPLTATLPAPTAFIAKGASVLLRCTLQSATQTPAIGASGNLVISDIGVDGLAAPQTVLSLPNAFAVNGPFPGTYSYTLSTSPAAFVSGHYFKVTATWNDGSTTTRYFYLL